MFVTLLVLPLGACKTSAPPPAVVKAEPVTVTPELPEPDFEEAPVTVNPIIVSQEVYDSTKIDLQKLIENLNEIIRSKDYKAWVTHLSEEYFETIKSKTFLSEKSDTPLLKVNKIVLRSPQEYFNTVVVPSRANDHVDDIEFISPDNVKAYTVTSTGAKLRLYDLVKINGVWKIAN